MLHRENLLKRIRTLEVRIWEGMERMAVMEAVGREQDRRLEKLQREMGVD